MTKKRLTYSAEANGYVIARAADLEGLERIARQQMFLHPEHCINGVILLNGNEFIKKITF